MRVITDQGWEIKSTLMTTTYLNIHFKACEFEAQRKWVYLLNEWLIIFLMRNTNDKNVINQQIFTENLIKFKIRTN